MQKHLLRSMMAMGFILAICWTPLRAQEFLFQFKGPDKLYVNNACGAILTLHPDSLVVQSLIGAQVTDTLLSISGQYNLGDVLPAGTVVTFSWAATDDQGHDSVFVFTISVLDTLPPNFSTALPIDVTVSCAAVPPPPLVQIFDNCDASPALEYMAVTTSGPCTGAYTITREWVASDQYGNSRVHTQIITVTDTDAPLITGVPADTIVRCDAVPAPAAGVLATDGCDLQPVLQFQADTLPGFCPQQLTILRIWTAVDDCGNSSQRTQLVEVVDTLAPQLMGVPEDVTVSCEQLPDVPVIGPGGISATDGCSDDPPITFLELSNQSPDPADCGYLNYEITRTWTAVDACGNLSSQSQVISVRDLEPPTLFCPTGEQVQVAPGTCLAVGQLIPTPFATDQCAPGGVALFSDTIAIRNTSGTPLLSGVVDTVWFQFAFAGFPAQWATGPVDLHIDLLRADAEQPGEFYRIYAEDGQLLGQTLPTPSQCGSGQTVISGLTPEQINAWAADGAIGFYLVPDGDGVEAINQICAEGQVALTLTFPWVAAPASGISFRYRIDGGVWKALPGGSEALSAGSYTVTLEAEDCSGHTDTCTYILEVQDLEQPAIVCPPAMTISTDANTCTAALALPFPTFADDNCGFGTVFSAGISAQPLVFQQDPNAGIVPSDIPVVFSNVAPAGPGFAVLQVWLRGDIADSGEFFEVYGENGTFLGVTGAAAPIQECTDEVVFTFFIDEALIRDWSADGQIPFTLVSNKDVLLYNDFIQPCGPLQPNGTDGLSYARLNLSYSSIETAWLITADPTGDTLAQGAMQWIGSPAMVSIPTGAFTATYQITDADGNARACSWAITVEDKVPPVVVCKPGLFVRTNPSGLVDLTLDPASVLMVPALDNCGIAGLSVTPNTFSCQDAGTAVPVQLIAVDHSGNTDTCTSLVAVQNESLTPSFALDTCGGQLILLPDTTFTVPSPGSGDFFVFTWTGPNGFISNLSHPVILQPNEANSGTYTLSVQGLTGCVSSGSITIEVAANGAFRPVLEVNTPICQGDSIRLSTDWQGAQRYVWIHLPSGSFYETDMPTLVVPGLPALAGNWTLQVFPLPACPSLVSLPVEVIIQPLSVQLPSEVTACEGDQLNLPGTAVNGASFFWTAPDGTTINGQHPLVTVQSGVYRLRVVSPQGCEVRDSLVMTLGVRPLVTAIHQQCPDCVSGTEDCVLTPTVLPPDTGGLYQYRWLNPMGALFATGPVASLTNLSGAQSGLYRLEVESLNNTCRSKEFSTFITLKDRPATPLISATGGANPLEICEGEQAILQLQSGAYSGNVRYLWEGPLGTDTTAAPSLFLPVVQAQQAGIYHLAVLVNGCLSNPSNDQVIHVNPIPAPPVITSNSPICEGDTLTLCAPFQADAQWEWISPQGSQGTDFCLIIPDAATNLAGAYQVRIAVKGCFSVFGEPLEVEIRERPQAPVVGDNCGGAICRDTPGSCFLQALNAPAGAQYYWFDGNTDTLIALTGTVSSLELQMPGVYSEGIYRFYSQIEVEGCRSLASAEHAITINTIPAIEADAGPDLILCEGEALTLCAQTPLIGSGEWVQTGGPAVTILQPGNPCSDVLGYQPGEIHTFSWLLSNGACVHYSTDEAQVTISRFEQAVAPALLEVCRSDEAVILAAPGQFGPGIWSQLPGQAALGIVISDPGQASTTVSGLESGNRYFFRWTLPNGACAESSVSLQLNNYDDVAIAGPNRQDCGYGCLTLPLQAEPALLGSGRWYSPDPGITITVSGEAAATACGLRQGANLFIWELNQGLCGESAYDTLVVQYTLGPVAQADTFQVPFAGQVLLNLLDNDQLWGSVTTTIVGPPGAGTLQKVSEGQYIYTPPIQFIGTTYFRYRICSTTCPDICTEATIQIEVEENDDCAVPTIITPNFDGINDALVIPCLAQELRFPQNSLSIFNQWGDEVYRAAPYRNDWEGTYQGQALPSGTYFFVFDPGNGEQVRSGFLLIKN